jgi:hypothetical protein
MKRWVHVLAKTAAMILATLYEDYSFFVVSMIYLQISALGDRTSCISPSSAFSHAGQSLLRFHALSCAHMNPRQATAFLSSQ